MGRSEFLRTNNEAVVAGQLFIMENSIWFLYRSISVTQPLRKQLSQVPYFKEMHCERVMLICATHTESNIMGLMMGFSIHKLDTKYLQTTVAWRKT